MITRFALFLSLLALFYYYCKEDSSSYQPDGNNINLIESPSEFVPGNSQEVLPETFINLDSTHYISGRLPKSSNSKSQFVPVSQNY